MTKRRRGEREVGERVQAADHGDATSGSDDSIGSGTGEHEDEDDRAQSDSAACADTGRKPVWHGDPP